METSDFGSAVQTGIEDLMSESGEIAKIIGSIIVSAKKIIPDISPFSLYLLPFALCLAFAFIST